MPQKKTKEAFAAEVKAASPNIELLENYVSSTTPILCRCRKCGNVWKAHPRYLLKGINCPQCGFVFGGGRVKGRTHDEFINEMKDINPSIQILGTYKNAQTKIRCLCKVCGYSWEATPNSLLRASGCKKCAGLIPWTTDEFKAKISEVNESLIVIGDYTNNRTKIKCRCKKCAYEWDAVPTNLLNGHGCPRCGDVLAKSEEQFLTELSQGKNPNVEVLEKYTSNKTPIKCRCAVCGYEWETLPRNIIKGFGCARCAGSAKKDTDEFITQLKTIAPDVEVLDEYVNRNTRIKFYCNRCGNEWMSTPANILAGHGCQRCSRASTSFMEQYIFSALTIALGGDKVLSRDKSTVGMEIDIISPNYKVAVEIGAWYWHKNRVMRDIEKQVICSSKGIRLFTIYDCCGTDNIPEFTDCFHYPYSLAYEEDHRTLKSVVTTILDATNTYFCFAEGDWKKISEYATLHAKRKGISDYQIELSHINPQIEIIGDHFISGRKVKCRCKICGYEWDGFINNLLRGTQCRKCLGLCRKTTEQFINEAKLRNDLVDVIGEYKNDNTPISCKCKKCGHIWETRPRNILKGCGCPKCKGERISRAKRKITE